MLRGLRRRLAYARYRRAQIRQSKAKRHKDASFRLEPFVDLIVRACPALGPGARVLCIGARNEVELRIFERRGFHDVTGVDLWSPSSRIRVMDMHRLDFPDASFDLVFGSHVFEHAWDFGQVARECVRVLRPGGFLFAAFPADFETNAHDRVDFKSAEGFLTFFRPWAVDRLHAARKADEVSVLIRVGAPARVATDA